MDRWHTVRVLVEAAHDVFRTPFVRMSINGDAEQDFPAKAIEGVENMFMASATLPSGHNLALMKLGKAVRQGSQNVGACSQQPSTAAADADSSQRATEMAANAHIIDIVDDSLVHMKWGREINNMELTPGPQLFFLNEARGKEHIAIVGNIPELGVWDTNPDIEKTQKCLRLSSSASIVAVARNSAEDSVAFNVMSIGQMETCANKVAQIQLTGDQVDFILASTFDEPSVSVTEIAPSKAVVDINSSEIKEYYHRLEMQSPQINLHMILHEATDS